MNNQLDSLNVFGSLKMFPKQCGQVITDMASIELPQSFSSVQNVVVSGMGGSALGGRVVSSLERQTIHVPVVISTEYHLPNFVNEKSLVIVSSYSGNTRETLASLAEARARGAQIFILASGGKLAEAAANFKIPAYIFTPQFNPSNQPRIGLGYNTTAIVSLLSRCHLIEQPEDLGQLPDFLTAAQAKHETEWQEIAKKISGKIPVLVASEHLKGAVHCFKNQINENAKTFAVMFDFPELSHHLLEGMTFPKTNPDNLQFVLFTSEKYNTEIQKSYPVISKALEKLHLPQITIPAYGPSKFLEAFDAIQSGGFIAFHTASTLGIDPGPIPWVDWYKDEIRQVV
jgi:glucose/mannose-6-phosphate isomerase